MKYLLSLLTLFCILGFSPSLYAEDAEPQIKAETEIQTLPTIHPGDHVQVYVYGDEDLTGEYRIDPRGVLTLPLIGELPVSTLNKRQLEEKIAAALVSGGYYNEPKVTVDVSTLQPFYILGEVRTPGSYAYTADLDVFKAIAIAGGYTPRADKKDITIMRKVDGQKVKIQASEETEILPGDSINVDQRFF